MVVVMIFCLENFSFEMQKRKIVINMEGEMCGTIILKQDFLKEKINE